MSNNTSIFKKYKIFNDFDVQLLNSIKLFYIAYQQLVFFITIDDEVFMHNTNDGIKRINELCNKNIIKFESNGESNPYFMALNEKGSVYSWGYNSYGQLGQNFKTKISTPNIMTHFMQYYVIDISFGYQHSLVLTREGYVFACGYNAYGQCGNNSFTDQIIPIKIDAIKEKVIAIACGYNHSTALTNSGMVYVWGDNKFAQLGISATVAKQSVPMQIVVPQIKKIICGPKYTLLLSVDGDMFCCGHIAKRIGFKKIKQINTIQKFIDISASIRCHFFVALSEFNKYFIYGKYRNEYLKDFSETNHLTIEDVFAYYLQITFKSIMLDISTNENELLANQSQYKTRFTEINCLGSGAYSNVFKASDKVNNKLYAVKKVCFDSDKQEKALKELEFLSKLKNNFIVKYFKSWIEPNYYIGFNDDEYSNNISSGSLLFSKDNPHLLHIQMELCSLTLRDAINIINKECKTQENTLSLIGYYISSELMIEILECVNYLHSQTPSIIHRDLKPENILLTNFVNNRFVKLSDFGLSTFHEFADQSHTKNVGTKNYIAPEIMNTRKYTTKSDIYSLGTIMQELLFFDFEKYQEYKEINPKLTSFYDWVYSTIINMVFYVPVLRKNCGEILENYNGFFDREVLIKSEDVKRILNGTNKYKIEDNFVEYFIYCKLK